MDLATCLFAGLQSEHLQDKQVLDDRTTGSNDHKIYAKEVLRFVRHKDLQHFPNPFDIPDEYFVQAFRLNKFLFQDFLLLLCLRTYYRPEMDTNRLPFDLRVLATLTYLSYGHFEVIQVLEAFKGVRPKVLQHCVAQICQTIVHFMSTDYIVFPSNNDEALSIKNGFYSRYGISNVVGVMDCFHIRLSKVEVSEEHAFKCRHGNLSINVQVICDHKSRFLDVNPRAPGNTSDMFVWKRSHINGIVKNLFRTEPTWLIADRGYNLDDVLINPYRNPNSGSELRLNSVFDEMLVQLDTAVVMLTSRFRCLKTVLPYNHQRAANIVTACVTLHNYLISKDYAMEEQLMSIVPKRRPLPNAHFEDEWSAGYKNREYIKGYLNRQMCD